MGDKLFNKAWKVSAWRNTVPPPWIYWKERLVPGEQLEITEHRIKFKITRGFSKKPKPNTCDLYIYNLAAWTRADLETLPLSVQIDAGYDNTPRLLFLGDLRFARSEVKSGTYETLLQLGDGSRAHAHARMNRAYKTGTTYRTVLADAAKSMGLKLPPNLDTDPNLDRTFETGTTAHGYTRDELTRLLAPFGYHWSIQNDELRVLRDEQVVRDEAIPIDVEHGMVESPRWGSTRNPKKPPTLHVKTLLYPEIVPGDLISLTSDVKTGFFRTQRVEHTGDTHQEGDWITDLELVPYNP